MTVRQRLLARLFNDVQLDLADYRRLHVQLQHLHDHLLARRSEAVVHANQLIDAQLATLGGRARDRVRIFHALHLASDEGAMTQLLASLTPALQPPLQTAWTQLGDCVRACRQLNERNARVLRQQHEHLQRLLGDAVPGGVYAPPLA